MVKPVFVGAAIAAAVVVGGGVYVVVNQQKQNTNSDSSSSAQSTTTKKAVLNDPDGVYKLFSDPSVTKHPADGVKFGNGQTLTFEYDGSKTANDQYATLSYQLFYIQDDGKVQPMGGGNVVGEGGKGTFTLSDKVFNSMAKDRQGFLELTGTYDSGIVDGKITAKNVKLGMYSIAFDISE